MPKPVSVRMKRPIPPAGQSANLLPYARGGPLAAACGAKTRKGGLCQQAPLRGQARCRMHGGPKAAGAHRARLRKGVETGRVSPEALARAEARRARNALEWAWTRDPRLPGQTIDLGPAEGTFLEAARALGVDAGRLYPPQVDWLRWKWQRAQRDRQDPEAWTQAVLTDLPQRMAAAEVAVMLADLDVKDGRTREARAAKAAFRIGGAERARQAVEALREAVRLSRRGVEAAKLERPLTAVPAAPWVPRQGVGRWKRRLPDQPKATPAMVKPKRPPGRPPRVPDAPDEVAALAEVLRAAPAPVRAMFDALPGQDQHLPFLRDLAAFARAPDDAGARARWAGWVAAVRLA